MYDPIAVTGLGLTTCLGTGVEANREMLGAGRSGLGDVTRFPLGDYPVGRAGEIPTPRPRKPHDSFETTELVGAIREALESSCAGARPTPVDPTRRGLALGSSLAGSSTSEAFFEAYVRDGAERANYGLLEGYYIEDLIDRCARDAGLAGPSALCSNACAAGASSIALGARWLAAGRADLVVAAGFDPLSIFTFAGFGSLMALSASVPRPFSAERDGMLLGDGFSALVLERAEDATKRGAPIVGWLLGAGESTDAYHLTRPHPEGDGAALAMRRSLERAGVDAAAIQYVNCHGTGTQANDSAEAHAMRSVFGERLARLPISSSKPFFGHTLGGAGTVEAVVTLLALADGRLPPNLGVERVGPDCAPLDLVRETRDLEIDIAMSNSFGFGGSNTSLVLARAGWPAARDDRSTRRSER